mgnify:CR=1 FL=1
MDLEFTDEALDIIIDEYGNMIMFGEYDCGLCLGGFDVPNMYGFCTCICAMCQREMKICKYGCYN